MSALALLAAWAEIPREPVVEYFLWLAEEWLEREPNRVWDSLAAECADIEALVVFPRFVALEENWRDESGLIEPEKPYRAPSKVGRNEPCSCGSGKKFKKCCGR